MSEREPPVCLTHSPFLSGFPFRRLSHARTMSHDGAKAVRMAEQEMEYRVELFNK